MSSFRKEDYRMLELIEKNIIRILIFMEVDNKIIRSLAKEILEKHKNLIMEVLYMPEGGTLTPEEFAQAIVDKEIERIQVLTRQSAAKEAATALYTA